MHFYCWVIKVLCIVWVRVSYQIHKHFLSFCGGFFHFLDGATNYFQSSSTYCIPLNNVYLCIYSLPLFTSLKWISWFSSIVQQWPKEFFFKFCWVSWVHGFKLFYLFQYIEINFLSMLTVSSFWWTRTFSDLLLSSKSTWLQ